VAFAALPQTGHRSPKLVHGLTPTIILPPSMLAYSITVWTSASARLSILFVRQGLSGRLM